MPFPVFGLSLHSGTHVSREQIVYFLYRPATKLNGRFKPRRSMEDPSERTLYCHRGGHTLQVFAARDFDGAQRFGGRRHHLDVKQGKAAPAQMPDQVMERNFGSTADAVEHGFAREQAADGHAVNPAHQFALEPALDAVGVSLPVQPRVRFDEFFRDPDSAPSRCGRCTAFHHCVERLVNGNLKPALANDPGQALGNVKSVQFKNRPRIGRPPGDGINRPRKNPRPVGRQQPFSAEVAANGHQPLRVSQARVGEGDVFVQQDRHG